MPRMKGENQFEALFADGLSFSSFTLMPDAIRWFAIDAIEALPRKRGVRWYES
jgi:hypothetical protein